MGRKKKPLTLRAWCMQNETSLSAVMRKANVAYTTVLRAADGKLSRHSVAERISEATGGEVSVATLCGASQ